MASASRSAQFAKIHKVVKKHYKPVLPPEERSVLEHLLFASCLEDARYEAAEEAFGALGEAFFDRNEVRVASISELAEVMAALPDPRAAANRIKRILHGVFEELYSFDLEDKRKKNLGPTVKWLEKLDGTSRFSVAYLIQAALAGHSIPIDAGTMSVFRVLDLATEKEAAAGEVPGLERAVSKSKGIEFGSLIHQLGADYLANPFSPQIREIIVSIDADAAKRFPQRRQPRPEAPAPAPRHAATAEAASASSGRKKKGDASAPAKPVAEAKAADAKSTAAKGNEHKTTDAKVADGKFSDGKKSAAPAGKKSAETSHEPVPHAKSDKSEKHAKPEGKSEREKGEKSDKRSANDAKHSAATEALGKRKPR